MKLYFVTLVFAVFAAVLYGVNGHREGGPPGPPGMGVPQMPVPGASLVRQAREAPPMGGEGGGHAGAGGNAGFGMSGNFGLGGNGGGGMHGGMPGMPGMPGIPGMG
ncbi:uncharacterized protein LOC106659153 [Trichogramma pretiosum]|uniref:uncharacterized protein LOC106659153 n=1 Tax=Trichogramma pretiosum TaxID=7493 RepID=UPI0006C950E3|nr:uncharacterized protein LOC106659153 [Trichogramma pretiosum]